MADTERIKINVGGQVFLTKRSTLLRYPDTKLSNVSETCEYHDKTTNEYYFDRNPLVFQSILDYYRTGNLHFVSNVCAEHIREELKFWEISTSDLGPCCWKYFYTVENDLKTVEVVEKHFFRPHCVTFKGSKEPLQHIKNKLWNFLEHPKSSKYAMSWQIFYLGVVCLALTLSILQSFELLRENNSKNVTMSEDVKQRLTRNQVWSEVFVHFCNIVFILDTTLRLVTCPDKREFVKSFLNIVDIISVIGYLIFVVLQLIPDKSTDYESLFIFAFILVILQGFRFFRLERLIEGLRLMLLSIKQSKKMLCLLILVLVITSIIFGIMIHVMEMDGLFSDPIRSFYWAIITMTTVGYGDIFPKTHGGQIVASACATVGLFLLSMPIAVVANTFTDLYHRYMERRNHSNFQKQNFICKCETTELIPVKF